MREQEVRVPPAQCDGVFSLQTRFVDERGDTTHDVLYLCA